MRLILPALALMLSGMAVWGQTDPGAAQDKEAERLKLLRAADQLDTMSSQIDAIRTQSESQKSEIEALKTELAEAKTDNAQLRTDIATLKSAIEKLDASRAEERDVLLKKVSEIVAQSAKAHPTSGEVEGKPTTPGPSPAPSEPQGEGYTYVVKKGDTLHDIAAAYQGQGDKVTVDDLRKANKLDKTSMIHTGQKLFIPKK